MWGKTFIVSPLCPLLLTLGEVTLPVYLQKGKSDNNHFPKPTAAKGTVCSLPGPRVSVPQSWATT
jgi:hypothetical protein